MSSDGISCWPATNTLKVPLSSQPRGCGQGRDLIAQTAGRQRVPQGLRAAFPARLGKTRANRAFAPLQHVSLEAQVLSQGAIVRVARNLVRLNRAPDAHGYARATALENSEGKSAVRSRDGQAG